jgi:hypothetical protein
MITTMFLAEHVEEFQKFYAAFFNPISTTTVLAASPRSRSERAGNAGGCIPPTITLPPTKSWSGWKIGDST